MEEKLLKLALIGFGNAAQSFAELLLLKKEHIQKTTGTRILVTAIAGNSKGTLINDHGIDLREVLYNLKTSNIFDNALRLNTFEMLERTNADVAIELSPLSIKDGQPAIDYIKAAFAKGMHVITANKGPIAWAFNELCDIARKNNLQFLYECTVMDGTPVFNLVKYTLPGCEVISFEGILNTTTNYILGEMEQNRSFKEAVKEAQQRGFAEADPSMDITGMDAAAKTCALANVLMNAGLNPTMIETHGIEHITTEELNQARKDDSTIKLLCMGFKDERGVHGIVKPAVIPLSHPFATVEGTSSVLSIETDLMGKITIIEHDPEIEQTAYGIFSDMMQLI